MLFLFRVARPTEKDPIKLFVMNMLKSMHSIFSSQLSSSESVKFKFEKVKDWFQLGLFVSDSVVVAWGSAFPQVTRTNGSQVPEESVPESSRPSTIVTWQRYSFRSKDIY